MQITNASGIRQAHNSDNNLATGKYASSYKGSDVGGFIFKGERFFMQHVGGHSLDAVNIRAALGLVAEPGMFNGCMTCTQEGASALVIAVNTRTSVDDIISTRSDHFESISRNIDAPVFVLSNEFTVFQFNGGDVSIYRK